MTKRAVKQRAIFLDRDGTLIKQADDIVRPSQIHVLENIPEGLRMMRDLGYRLIVITNQPVVGKGLITKAGVEKLNNVLNARLQQKKASIDAFYVCPHRHWDKCPCRKPKLGLVREAGRRFKIDLRQSFFIGDDLRDVETGKRGKMRTVLVETGNAGADQRFFDAKPDFIAKDLLAAAKIVKGVHRG